MVALISVFIILASILLIAVVFIQNPKGGGLSSDFGAAQQLGGVQRTNDFIEKSTWTLAATIMLLSILMTNIMAPEKPKEVAPTEQQQTGPGPNNPGQPGL